MRWDGWSARSAAAHAAVQSGATIRSRSSGVVGDTVNRASTNEIWPEMYMPFTILGRADRILVLGAAAPRRSDSAVKAQVYARGSDAAA